MEENIYQQIKDIEKIEALSIDSNKEYEVCSQEDSFGEEIKENSVFIVAGSFFGDEGKGKMTDAIASNPSVKIIARVNSGENAGHSVCNGEKQFVFHLTPSAIGLKDKICLIGSECVMDPVSFVEKEINQLKEAGIEYKSRFFVGNTHIVTPIHKILDFALSKNNSSTLKGMSYIHASKARKMGLRLNDLFNSEEIQKQKIKKELSEYQALIKNKNLTEEIILKKLEEFSKEKSVPNHLFDFLKAENKEEYLVNLYKKYVVNNEEFPRRIDVSNKINDSLEKGEKILLESPQSYWLSNAIPKHWGSSTSAQTHAAGVLASSGINFTKYKIMVINVVKTPGDSRVGIGANPAGFVPQDYFSKKGINDLGKFGNSCIDFEKIQKQYFESIQENGISIPNSYEDESGKYKINEALAISMSRHFGEKGATTGKPRVTGMFDLVAFNQVIKSQGPYFSISALDRGDDLDKISMVVAYIYYNEKNEEAESNGKTYKNFDMININSEYPCERVLKYCHPIIRLFDSWKDKKVSHKKRESNEPLPKEAQKFIAVIEELTKAKIISVGNGPNTENLIYLKRK